MLFTHLPVPLVHFPLPNINVAVAVSERGIKLKTKPKMQERKKVLVNARALSQRIRELSHVAAAVVVRVQPLPLCLALDERRPQLAATGPETRLGL